MAQAKEKQSLQQKVGDMILGLKNNWNVPKPGEYTSIKEFMFYCLGIMGVCAFTFICGDTVCFTASYLCGSIFEIQLMDFTIITFISDPANKDAVEELMKDKVSGDGYTFLCSLLDNFSQMVRTADGKDKVMYTVYYVFYSALVAGVATNNAFAEFNGNYSFLQSLFNTSDLAFMRAIGQSMYDIFHIKDDEGNEPISPIIDETGVVPQGQIPFWQKIIEFFKQIINFFKNMFK